MKGWIKIPKDQVKEGDIISIWEDGSYPAVVTNSCLVFQDNSSCPLSDPFLKDREWFFINEVAMHHRDFEEKLGNILK